ncbi:MAG: hypothetical protein AB7S71_15285 [Dongiaceae bacterium]
MDRDAEGRMEAELIADSIRAHGDALGGNLVHFKRFLDALLERQSKAADATAQQHLAVNQTAARAAQAATDAARKSARAAMWSVVVAMILAALTAVQVAVYFIDRDRPTTVIVRDPVMLSPSQAP